MENNKDRRDFLKKSAVALGGLTILPTSTIFAGKKVWNEEIQSLRNSSYLPSEKVNLACIGIGHRGCDIVKDLYNTGLVNIVALCDVDLAGDHTQEIQLTASILSPILSNIFLKSVNRGTSGNML